MYLNGRLISVHDRLHSISAEEIAVYSIVKAELCFGAMKSADPEHNFAPRENSKFPTTPLSIRF